MIFYLPSLSVCKDEQSFKMKYIKDYMRIQERSQKIFCIETEETVKGFPDVMEVLCMPTKNVTYFYEFKFSDNQGKIKFQSTQPAFYKRNKELDIDVIAYNKATKTIHQFKVKELFNKGSPYYMNLKAEVNLRKAEKEKNESINN